MCARAVEEIDLALWRSAEDIANDKREFMIDGEWELLSVPSRYSHVQQDSARYAQIQFNASVVVPLVPEGEGFGQDGLGGQIS